MENFHLFEFLLLWGTFLGIVAIVLLAIVGGIAIARSQKKSAEEATEGAVGTVAGATLGLLAFILAFTFGLTASRFDTRYRI